jgi:lipopolysaccharide transport system ATP-binding protein
MNTVIQAENLGKKYIISHQKQRYRETLRDAMTHKARDLYWRIRHPLSLNSRSSDIEDFWALEDLNFEVEEGSRLGIIGRNGSGKSTLLKILSRITEPTTGRVRIKGRVSSLLEVGTGFHPELSGRENIFLNGAILGMNRHEIKRKFDEIVAFAEIEKFLDTPVKRYSSGMYVRLAFAVAAHLEPEILIIDEVLAVGDVEFQKKCLGKMGEVAQQGRTVLFVSHNMGAITRLCERAIWLDEGRIVSDGVPNELVRRYESQCLTTCAVWKRINKGKANGGFAFTHAAVKNNKGQATSLFAGDESISVEIQYTVHRPLSGCQIGTRICNSDGLVAFYTADSDNSGVSALPKEPGLYRAVFIIPGNFLAPGTYYLLMAAHLPYRTLYEVIEQAVVFEVSPTGSLASLDGRLGVISPLIDWETSREPLL